MFGGKEFQYRTDVTVTVDWACYVLSFSAIFYLLVRHALLLRRKLKPGSLACGDCAKATCATLKVCLCAKAPESVTASPTLSSTCRKRSRSASTGGSGSRSVVTPIITYGTFGCLIFYSLFAAERSICYMAKDTLKWLPFHYCHYAIAVASNLYLIAKSCMYTVFVARLKQGFQGSKYALSETFIKMLYASVAAYTVGFSALYTAFARGKVEDVSKSVSYCEPIIPNVLLLALVGFEFVFVSLVVYLFASRLSKMYGDFAKHADESSKERYRQENVEMLLLPLKYTILSTVAVASTISSLVLLAFANTEFVLPFDCALNCASLVLMTGQWAPVYILLCSPLLRCVAYTPWLPCTDLTQEQLSTLVRSASKSKGSRSSVLEASGASSFGGFTSDLEPVKESQGSQLTALELVTI